MPIALPAAIIGSSVLGGIFSSNAADKAASAQQAAAAQASQTQLAMFNQTQANLAPFIQGGGQARDYLAWLTGVPGTNAPTGLDHSSFGALTSHFAPTMDQLSQTPGYQFTLDQGLKATQNSYAARGLASSGVAMKGAADYAEGLAGTTFQQQFQNDLSTKAQGYNMISGLSTQGSNAAAQQGTIAANVGANVGNNLIGGANAAGASYIAGANAIGGAANSIPTAIMANNNPYFNGSFANGNAGAAGAGGGNAWANPFSLPATNAYQAGGFNMPTDI